MKDYKGIICLTSPPSALIQIGNYSSYTSPPLLNGGVIKYSFPLSLHNAFVVTKGVDEYNQSLFAGPEPLVNYHTSMRKHVNWTLISVNPEWQNTTLWDNRIKWDY